MSKRYDVLVIGAGIVGSCVLHELSGSDLQVAVLERENDAAQGTTKANSAILHAGYDPLPGSRMAFHNVRGNELIKDLCREYDVPFKECGSLVIAKTEEEEAIVQTLYERGLKNGVPGLKILSAEETVSLEPSLSDGVLCSLLAPTAGIVNPWALCIALTEDAVRNGVDPYFDHEVTEILPEEGGYTVRAANGAVLKARFLVLAAGVYADKVHDLLEPSDFHISPAKGEYYLLDKNQGGLVSRVIFQCPSKAGKGVLVAPTVHGNLLVGPDRTDGCDREDVSTEGEHLRSLRKISAITCDKVDFRQSIRNFAGLRAVADTDEFIVRELSDFPGVVELAGIQSPGLTSAPSLALEAVELLKKAGLSFRKNETRVPPYRPVRIKELSPEEQQKKIAENPLYGRVICRCETVTEGEIVDALRSPIIPPSIDAVKRRVNAGMGRCQGGFCSPRVLEIIAREKGISPAKVLKDKPGSFVLVSDADREAGR